jgi:hypothetical protein
VLSCTGGGTTSQIVAGINWVTNNHIKPAVANMSLGGSGTNTTMNNAVANSINAGVSYAIAAGNSNANACNFSPAQVSTAITVGSTQSNDARSSFSNFGTCVNIFAPGTGITSAWHTSNSATNTISGTSMAAPTSPVRLPWCCRPTRVSARLRCMNRLISDSTTGVISSVGSGSPNRLLFVDNSGGGTPPPPPPPGGTFYQDSFETSTGWTLSGSATAGIFERGVPEATSANGVALQLSSVPHGSLVAVTGRLAGANAGTHDVDGGGTVITSPSISIPSSGNINLVYEWTFAHLNNATNADFFRVSIISGGSTTVVHNVLGAASNRAGSWSTADINMNNFRGSNIQIRIEVADNATASLIEGAVDNVRLIQS